MLKIGDKVHIVTCAESEKYGKIVFTVISEPWKLGHGEEVIRITSPEKDFRGGFATKYLRKIE